MANTLNAVDVNKADGKPTIDFSPMFMNTFTESINAYDEALENLKSIVNGSGFTGDYGVCNVKYQMTYVTPKDLSSYVSDLLKAISKGLVACTVSDLERLSVEMAKRFVYDNSGVELGRDNLMATATYVDPRTQTLMDILVQTQNTFFDRMVYSKYEMNERTKAMKKDVDTMNGMHFGAAMKAVVNQLPKLIENAMGETVKDGCVCCDCALVTAYIETFILFMCSLNTCCITQMIGYARPRSTFLEKENDKVTQESFSTRNFAPIMVVLSAGDSKLAKPIRAVTHSKWTHCSLAFDPDLKEMFSYGARLNDDEENPNKMGLKRESLQASNLSDKDICVFGFYIPAEIHEQMHKNVLERYADRDNSKFDLLLLFKKALNDNTKEPNSDTKKICTTFTNDLIRMCGRPLSDKSVPSPQQMKDACEMSPTDCTFVFEGLAADYNGQEARKRLRAHARRKASKPFAEYFVEYCPVQTNKVTVRARIPFDINMRSIVLCDATPNFKDVMSALHFMIDDTRSPINTLLVKFATLKSIPGSAECAPCITMFEPYLRHCECDGCIDNGRSWLREVAGFNTDPNWLDKIAYGNQFMDGNYRLDAVGNENKHPILRTLEMLHRMYCGCGLKTNEELADNILRIAGVMKHVVMISGDFDNRELVVDILSALGDCFTRNVMRLYSNNTTVIVYDDDMQDTMIPGYQFCEEFAVYVEDGTVAKPVVQVQDGDGQQIKTMPKNAVLSKLASLIRKFSEWLQKKFANVPNSFTALNGPKIAYIKAHAKMNTAIGDAIKAKSLTINLTNFPLYKIPAKDMINKSEALANALQAYKNDHSTIKDVQSLEAMCYPGDEATAKSIAAMTDEKAKQQAISNYILFSDTQKTYTMPTPMQVEGWNEMVNDLLESQKLVEAATKAMYTGLKKASDLLQGIVKEEETAANKAGNQNQEGASVEMTGDIFQEADPATPQGTTAVQTQNMQLNGNGSQPPAQQGQQAEGAPTVNAKTLYDAIQKIMTNYQMRAVNLLTKQFFDTYYDAYKKIVDAYQTQTKTNKNPNNAAQQPAVQQPAAQESDENAIGTDAAMNNMNVGG